MTSSAPIAGVPDRHDPFATTQQVVWISLLIGTWFCGVMSGFSYLLYYDATPDQGAEPPTQFTEQLASAIDRERPRLLLFAHPRCPCTRATLNTLAEIIAGSPVRPNVEVIFSIPTLADREWTMNDIVRQAETMTGVHVVADTDGKLAEHFGVKTSGHVLLYDSEHRLQFSGGITPGRGHSGESVGSISVCNVLKNESPAAHSTAVFGCKLVSPLKHQ